MDGKTHIPLLADQSDVLHVVPVVNTRPQLIDGVLEVIGREKDRLEDERQDVVVDAGGNRPEREDVVERACCQSTVPV